MHKKTVGWAMTACATLSLTFLATALASPAHASQQTLARGPGVIIPLDPPDSLMVPAKKVSEESDGFYYDDDIPERTFSIDATSRTLYEYHSTSGPGKAASFLDDGGHVMSDLELRMAMPMGENWKADLVSNMRLTQSRRYDPENFSMQYLQLVMANNTNADQITVGDYFASLSQYSLNMGIKGIGYQHSINQNSYFRVIGGSFHSRWNHLLTRHDDEPIDRRVLGGRWQIGKEDALIGFNVVSVWDRDDDPVRTTENTYNQVLSSVDWEYRLAALRLSGEHAYADTREQDVLRAERDISGMANRINANATFGALRLRARTERVSPDFMTLGGGAAPDRFRVFARGDYRLSRIWSIYGGADWYRNNLEDQLVSTTRTLIPEAGIRGQGLFDRRSLNMSTGLRRRIVETEGAVARENTSDRIFVAMSDRYREVSAKGEIELILNEHKTPAPRTTRNDILYRVILDSRHMLMNDRFDVRPYLTLEYQDMEDPTTGAPIRTHSARFDTRVLTLNDLSFGFNIEDRSGRSDVVGVDDFDELRFGINVEKRFAALSDMSVRLETGHNKYSFSDASRDYEESFISMSLEVLF